MRFRRLSRRVLRRLGAVGRLAVAVGLLVALWVGTVTSVERTTNVTEQRRLEDRLLIVRALAGPVDDWLEAGKSEAAELAGSIGGSAGIRAQAAIAEYVSPPRRFGRSALLVDGAGTVSAASGDLGVLIGRPLAHCDVIHPETPESTTDTSLRELVDAKRAGTGGATVSATLLVPGECQTPRVAVAAVPAAGGSNVTVVLGDPRDAVARVAVGELTGPDDRTGANVFLVDPKRTVLEPGGDPRSAPSRIAGLLDLVASNGEPVQRYGIGEDGNVERIGAVEQLEDGWSLVLEQDAGAFDLPPHERPSYIVASILVVVFAAVFGLLAYFDFRRQRAHRRAEVAKNAFFSVAGHELRTPLTTLKGFMETMDARYDDLTDDQRKMLLERMLPATRRLDRLVDRLLVAASIQSETHTHPQVAPMELQGVLEQAAEQFRPEAPLHTFIVQTHPDLPQVQADPKALEQVLRHLIDNAVKYSPTGGRVTIQATKGKRGVYVTVEDEGVGLPSDFSRIFEALVQGESVTKRVHDEGGMGVGLFIVRTLVDEMGGRVWAERRDPEGARFTVRLKAVRTRTEVPAAAGN